MLLGMGAQRSELARRLKFFLTRAGKTQAQVAREVDVSPGAVSKWISDDACPSLENLKAFCEACGVDMVTFYGPFEEAAPHEKVA